MKDTPPEIKQTMHEMMMARSGEERLVMGASMFDAARVMVLASLPQGLPEEELRQRLLERLYGVTLEQFLNGGTVKRNS